MTDHTPPLGPLPEPRTLSRGDEDGAIQLGYTADQMRAYALQERAAVQQWRPIETAPKDAHILLLCQFTVGHPLIAQGCWYKVDAIDQGWLDWDGCVLPTPTHWMPLPTPPQRAEPGKDAA